MNEQPLEDNTIRALKLLRRELQQTQPLNRDAFLAELTGVCIMATQGHLGIAFTNGLLDTAKRLPCPFVISLECEETGSEISNG